MTGFERTFQKLVSPQAEHRRDVPAFIPKLKQRMRHFILLPSREKLLALRDSPRWWEPWLSHMPFPLSPQDWHLHYYRDKDGLPLVPYRLSRWKFKTIYNPVTIAQYAMACIRPAFVENLSFWQGEYKKSCEWLLASPVPFVDDTLVYQYQVNIPAKGLESPWISAMAQGEAISVLAGYYRTTKREEILPTIEKLAFGMLVPAEKGGVLQRLKDGMPWLEEYPTAKPSIVLNGAVAALLGLMEAAKVTGNSSLRQMSDECLQATKTLLPQFIEGKTLLYGLGEGHRVEVGRSYYVLQTVQKLQLFHVTGDKLFLNWFDKFYSLV